METQLIVRLNGNDIVLDTYDLDPILLTLSFEDIATTAVTSNYSQTFRLPSSEANYQFFKTAFDVDGYDFDVTQKVESYIRLNGTDFVRGHLRLFKIYNRGEGTADYECVFMGEIRDFAGKLGSKSLVDIDWTDYVHNLSYANVTASWAAAPDTNNGLFNGDVIYPLVNFGNTYDDNGAPEQGVMQVGATYGFTSSTNAIFANRFKPMVRVPEVFRRVMDEAGFAYESNFLESEFARKLYVSAWGNAASISMDAASENLFRATISPAVQITDSALVPFNNESYDYSNNFSTVTHKYVAPINGAYSFDANINFTINVLQGDTGEINIYLKHNASVLTQASFLGTGGISDSWYTGVEAVTLTAGDEVYVEIEFVSSVVNVDIGTATNFQTVTAAGQVSLSNQFDPDYKQVDFIKDIMTLFHLVMVPHPYDSDKFVIEPFEDFVNAQYHADDANYQRIWDITDKVDYSKDVVIEPIFYTQQKQIDYTYAEDKDWLNDLNTKEFKETFGTLKTFSDNELLSGERKVEVKMASTPVTQIDNSFTTGAGMGNTIIPHIITKEANDNGVQNKPVKPKTRLLFWNGPKFAGLGVDYDQSVWYFKDDSNVSQPYDTYPRVSPYQDYPIAANSIDLNWQRERGYALYPILTGSQQFVGRSLYDTYWANYINSLYDKWARRVTLTVYLTPTDLLYPSFYWDKIVKVKGSYYRLDKIEGFNVSEPSFCKIRLIKLENPNVEFTTEPQLLWNEWGDVPNLVTTGWGNL